MGPRPRRSPKPKLSFNLLLVKFQGTYLKPKGPSGGVQDSSQYRGSEMSSTITSGSLNITVYNKLPEALVRFDKATHILHC